MTVELPILQPANSASVAVVATGGLMGPELEPVGSEDEGLEVVLLSVALGAASATTTDGKNDLVWRNQANGTLVVWLMDGATRTGAEVVGRVGGAWRIEGVGDFEGMGELDDLVWRNQNNGTVVVWLMDGATRTGDLVLGRVGGAWRIAGVGDFEDSGLRDDLVWRNQENGTIVIWLMEGTSRSEDVVLGSVGGAWRIAGVGDFEETGTPDDFLWRNPANGGTVVWWRSGTSKNHQDQPLRRVSAPWEVQATGDYELDGRDNDLVWRNPENGVNVVWFTDGRALLDQERLPNVLGDWAVTGTEHQTPFAPPFSFAEDAVIVSPGRNGRIRVVDGRDRKVPTQNLAFIVDQYTPGDPGGTIEVLSDGTIPWVALTERAWGFRVRADYQGDRLDGLVLVFVFDEHRDRVLLRTEHWRMAVPGEWLDRIATTIPDFSEALDVGWEAQKELFGMTGEEAHTFFQPNNPIGPFSSGMDDREVCGLSTVPLRFGRDCFVFPEGDPHQNQPRWFIIFHEMGHQSTGGNGIVPLFGPALCCGSTYTEGDASVASMWSSHRMMESPSLSAAARASVRSTFDVDTTFWRADLRTWEAGSDPFTDDNTTFNANMWDGIHAELIHEFGWDYILRYVRAWRNDQVVKDLVGIEVGDAGNTTLIRRATFAAASVSAALQMDLRDRFIDDWRFPIDQELYQQLYDYWLEAMDEPLP